MGGRTGRSPEGDSENGDELNCFCDDDEGEIDELSAGLADAIEEELVARC